MNGVRFVQCVSLLVVAAASDANDSGVWKESASGLEWIANDDLSNDTADADVSKQVARITDVDHDSDLDVEVEVVPRSQEEEEHFTEG